MAKRKNGVPQKRTETDEDLRAIYAQYKKDFTAADLQKYTEIEVGIPFQQVIAECEAILRRETGKRKKPQPSKQTKARKT